jgi:hypothetical protein
MSFEPDIIVTDEESPRWRIVVEAKLESGNREQAESALKRYMLGMSVPLGLIVTPTRLAVYRDGFTDFSYDSIKLVGEFDIPAGLFPSSVGRNPLDKSLRSPEAEIRFEHDVQAWLEQVASNHEIRGFVPEAQEALAEHVLPALIGGVIRAAGPRELRAS